MPLTELEQARRDDVIGGSLQAELNLYANAASLRNWNA